MKLITVSGPPSTGKTSVIAKVIRSMKTENKRIGVIKFDCLSTNDDEIYKAMDIPVKVGLSGNLCPDHFFVSNIEDCVQWGKRRKLDFLISESAGLCNRCSPHIRGVLAICVIDNLMGLNTPNKIGPMLKFSDIVVITKGDVVSQAEREVFAYRVYKVNPKAKIININGITGQGAFELSTLINEAADIETLINGKLRFPMPAALCSYCLGETKIGVDFQVGNVRKINLDDDER